MAFTQAPPPRNSLRSEHRTSGLRYHYSCPFLIPEPMTRTLEVNDELTEVRRVQEAFSAICAETELSEELEHVVALGLEEILTNVLRHGTAAGLSKEIRVRFQVDETGFGFEVSDACRPYNPLLRPDPNVHLPLEERRPGGLGVFLVKKLADELSYEWRDGRNHLWFLKHRFLKHI